MSINRLVSALFLSIAIVFITILQIQHYVLDNEIKDSQRQTMVKVLAVAAHEILLNTEKKMAEMSADIQKENYFRAIYEGLLKEPDNPVLKELLSNRLNEQYSQHLVTSNVLDLQLIRVYNRELSLVDSSDNNKSRLFGTPDSLIEKAKDRDKFEILKTLSTLWLNRQGSPMFSVIAPAGGLIPTGFIEIVVSPVLNLQETSRIASAPIHITSGEDILFSNNTVSTQNSENFAITNHILRGNAGEAILTISTYSDIEILQDEAHAVILWMITGVALSVISMLIIAAFIIRKTIIKPVKTLASRMGEIADGNMEIDTTQSYGIDELQTLNKSLIKVVENLRSRIVGIWQTGEQLSLAAKTMSSNAQLAVDRLRNQQTEVHSAANGTHELTVTAKVVADNANSTADLTQQANQHASTGEVIVTRANLNTEKLSSAIGQAANAIQVLNDQTKNVTTILDDIQNIAEQTNLLALNAAIEAARAGEQGRGFAVVADEVRSLAARTRDATNTVRNVLNELTGGISNTVDVMQLSQKQAQETIQSVVSLGQALQEISQMVSHINDMNSSIASSAEQQCGVTENLNSNLNSIIKMAEEVSETSLLVTSSSGDLAQMAIQLESLVGNFKVDGLTKNKPQESENEVEVTLF